MKSEENNILVSIVIPVYGVEKYIERCASSLFEQTYSNIEFVFVDDCTPDASIAKMNTILERYPQRKANVNVIKNISNCGQAAVRNIGVKHCHGQFLMHVDSDDWLDKNVVKYCIEQQKKENADIVIFDRKFHYKKNIQTIIVKEQENKEQILIQMLKREREVSIWGMLIRTTLYTSHNIKCVEGVNMSEDYQTSPRLVYFAKCITFAHGIYYNYECRNTKSISSSFTAKNVKQELVTLNVLLSFFSNKEEIFKQASDYGIAKQLCYFRHNAAYFKLDKLYTELSNMVKQINETTISTLPLPYRIGLHIHQAFLLRWYVGILKKLKTINIQ